MLSRNIALISEAPDLQFGELVTVAAALQKQATRDFQPIWGVRANVSAFADLEHMPLDYWPIIVKSDLGQSNAAGYHEDDLGEPCALVLLTDDWSVTASHEMLEMLADPWGRHLVAGQSPEEPTRRVKFLVEVCDPCSDKSYLVNGVAVADFYTPNYFAPVASKSVSYSYTGALTEPRQVLQGGYLTWHDPSSHSWRHLSWFDGPRPIGGQVPIPPIVKGNIRAAIDRHFGPIREKSRSARRARAPGAGQEQHPAQGHRAADIRRALAI